MEGAVLVPPISCAALFSPLAGFALSVWAAPALVEVPDKRGSPLVPSLDVGSIPFPPPESAGSSPPDPCSLSSSRGPKPETPGSRSHHSVDRPLARSKGSLIPMFSRMASRLSRSLQEVIVTLQSQASGVSRGSCERESGCVRWDYAFSASCPMRSEKRHITAASRMYAGPRCIKFCFHTFSSYWGGDDVGCAVGWRRR